MMRVKVDLRFRLELPQEVIQDKLAAAVRLDKIFFETVLDPTINSKITITNDESIFAQLNKVY